MKVQLKCPVCSARIADTDNMVTTKMKVIGRNESPLVNRWRADYYLKCRKCKSNIGIQKIE